MRPPRTSKGRLVEAAFRELGPACTLAQVRRWLQERDLTISVKTYYRYRARIYGVVRPQTDRDADMILVSDLCFISHLQDLARRAGGFKHLRQLLDAAERASPCPTSQRSRPESNRPAAIC